MAVFDGHGGREAAMFAAANIEKMVSAYLEKSFC
jgi:serine/threonine protein phosphatase PrpC